MIDYGYSMKFLTKIVSILIIVFFFNCSTEKEQILQIHGKVVETDTESILLLKPNQDMRFDSIIEIPVQNRKFNFESKLENPEVVTLLLGEAKENGGGRFMILFLGNERIDLTIYPEEEFAKNIAEGGKLNAQYLTYKKKWR